MVLYHILPFLNGCGSRTNWASPSLRYRWPVRLDKHKAHPWAIPVAALLFVAGAAESIQLRAMPLMTTDLPPSTIAEHIREEGGPVLNVPFDSGDASVVLQITHGQPILSGMGENSSYFKPAEHLDRMQNNSFIRFLDDIILEREQRQTFSSEDRASIEAQGFRCCLL